MKAHWLDTDTSITATTLDAEGIFHARHDTTEAGYRAPIEELKRRNGYIEEDVVALNSDTPNLEALCERFLVEHLHDEDEVRFVLEGEGVFDIRSQNDRYMRVTVEQGDLIVVPAKRYHRFMLTDKREIRCARLFKDKAGWVPHFR